MARPKSDIEPRIVRAARDRVLVEGVDAASLRRIARDAGTSIGMVYYYFPTKDELFLAVVEESYVALLSKLEAALAQDTSVRERIRRLYEVFGGLTLTERQAIQLVVREALLSSTRLERLIERFQRGHLPLVLRVVVDGLADGTFDPELPPGIVLMCVFALGGPPQVVRRVAGDRAPFGGLPEGSALSDLLVDVLLSGVGNRGARARSRPSHSRRSSS
jgi:AcrR family transcriptional regulator